MPSGPTILLMGPTAAGKTSLAIKLAKTAPEVDLISVDSAMVYRGLDIGTAKPSPKIRARYPHQLIDIRSPTEPYSVGEFLSDAKHQVAASHRGGRVPVLVGGSMLYFKALLNGLAPLPPADTKMRSSIKQFAELHGWPAVHKRLQKIDPKTAVRLHPQDAQRLNRAVEVYLSTGASLSEWWDQPAVSGLSGLVHSFILSPQKRCVLHQRIAKRFSLMLEEGLVAEVKRLSNEHHLSDALPASRLVGYRQVLSCLKGIAPWSELEFRAIVATRQMAKRQMTWLRSFSQSSWLPEDPDQALVELIRAIRSEAPN